MLKIICELPNASDLINGVKFSVLEDQTGVISEEISDEAAADFLAIPGYRLEHELDDDQLAAKAEAEAKAAAEKAAKAKATAASKAAAKAEAAAAAKPKGTSGAKATKATATAPAPAPADATTPPADATAPAADTTAAPGADDAGGSQGADESASDESVF